MKKAFSPVDMKNVVLTSGLLKERQELNAKATVPLIYQKCVETGRIESLLCKWEEGQPNKPHPFWDSDIGKMIEAVSYSLITDPNPAMEAEVDKIVDLLEKEQLPDGYLNTYYITCGIESRWTNLYYMHELYCAGHLIEGAVAYYKATGKRRLLDVMCRYADHIFEKFGREEGKIKGYCGHPEIELALVRLYEATGNEKYLELSKYFIDERGREPYFFELESLSRGVDTTKTANQKRHLKYYLKSRGPYAEYQAHKPVREQTEPVGHAVRVMYLYSGMADIAVAYDDESLYNACCMLWEALTRTQYSITGGIGSSSDGERFTFAYDLPNEYTYNETCASVALVMWAHRMLQFDGDGKYADVLEQTLYNTVLGSVSSKGDRFFYANYLSVFPDRFKHASAAIIDKMKAQRQEWFDVSCCPPNVSRLTGSVGGYIYSLGENGLHVHLYTASEARFDINNSPVRLFVDTEYPWDGRVKFKLGCKEAVEFDLSLRIPGWCKKWTVLVNGQDTGYSMKKGYCTIVKLWGKDDVVELNLSMPVMQVEANPRVRENCGRVALQRGPLVYCIEQADNGTNINDIAIVENCDFKEIKGIADLSEDAVAIEFEGLRHDVSEWSDELYKQASTGLTPVSVRAVPYYLWGNRGFGEMIVWLRKK